MNFGSALAAGYNIADILGFIDSNYPNIGKKIRQAKQIGYDTDQIKKFLTTLSPDDLEQYENSTEIRSGNNWIDADKTFQQRNKKDWNNFRKGIGLVAAPLGAYVAYRSLKSPLGSVGEMATEAIQDLFKDKEQQQKSNPQEMLIEEKDILPEEQQLDKPDIIPKQHKDLKGSYNAISKSILGNILKNVKQDITGEEARKIADKIGKGAIVRQIEKEQGRNFEDIFNDFKEYRANISGDGVEENVLVSEEKMPETGNTVLTRSGEIGTLEDIPGNTAKININGKKKIVKSDDIIDLPFQEKDLADLYEDLISGIEKKTGQQVSRNVNVAGYDPKYNELLYKPHDGSLYVYQNIDRKTAEDLLNVLTKRKTTGSNYIGAWEQGTESPIGAAMSKLILDLQKTRGGKGNEYMRKYDILYDALEPAKEALRQKHKQIKEKEHEKKRKAKKSRSS